LNEFSKNILQLIKLAKKYSSEIIFLGLTPVDETKTDPIPWKPGSSYKNEEIKQFDRIIKDLSRENYVGFVNISKVFNQQSCKKLLEDGVHPNSKGHEKIFYLVKTFLEKNNNI
jgi:lysophospholipase L1-like esterase